MCRALENLGPSIQGPVSRAAPVSRLFIGLGVLFGLFASSDLTVLKEEGFQLIKRCLHLMLLDGLGLLQSVRGGLELSGKVSANSRNLLLLMPLLVLQWCWNRCSVGPVTERATGGLGAESEAEDRLLAAVEERELAALHGSESSQGSSDFWARAAWA